MTTGGELLGLSRILETISYSEKTGTDKTRSVLENNMKKAKAKRKDLVVTVSGDRHIHEVTRDLRASGFQVDQVLDAIGVVTGSAAPTHVAKLRRIRGVKDVSSDQPVDIGPPGAPIS